MGKTTTKQTRPPVKASPPASAPITARDVWRFHNTDGAQGSNALVGPRIPDTLEKCAWVLAFLSDFHTRQSDGAMEEHAEAGLALVVDWLLDAINLQAKELEVDHG
jgi:hypothetical protein